MTRMVISSRTWFDANCISSNRKWVKICPSRNANGRYWVISSNYISTYFDCGHHFVIRLYQVPIAYRLVAHQRFVFTSCNLWGVLLTHPQFPFSQIPLLVLGNRIRNTNLKIFQGPYHWVKLMQSVPAFIHNYALKAISDPWNVTSFDISPAYEKYMVKETYHTAGDFLGKFTECLVDEMSLANLYTVGYSCKKLTTWVYLYQLYHRCIVAISQQIHWEHCPILLRNTCCSYRKNNEEIRWQYRTYYES